MMRGKQLWVLMACVLLSVIVTIWLFKKGANTTKNSVKDYVATEATVIQVAAARMTRFGITSEKYGLQFTAADGHTYTQYNCSLSRSKKVGDKIVVYYNPQNPHDPVTDQK